MPDPSTSSGSPRTESRGEWTEHLRARLASLSLSPAREAEIIEELSQHLDQRYEELRTGGTSDADAQRLTIEELLDQDALATHMGTLRQAHVPPPITPGMPTRRLLDDLQQDLSDAARTLRKQPGFAVAAVVTLALGIGATTAIFTVVNSVLINPLPYRDPDALVRIVHAIGGTDQPYFSDAVVAAYADNTQTLEDFGVFSDLGTATVSGQSGPEEVRAWTVSQGVLTTLDVRPEIGRRFSTADDTPGEPDTVILSNGYWHRKFAGDRAIVEQVLTIDARPHHIIGVMPAEFHFGGETDIILPMRINRARPIPAFRHMGLARLKPGITLEQANADVARILRIWLTSSGPKDPLFLARYAPSLRRLKQDVVGDAGNMLWVLMGTIGIVLLMACANVANLLLVRADARRQEFAIRAALGASRTRVARQLLVESLTLALLGGALGLGVAFACVRVLVALGPTNLPRLSEISIDAMALGFTLTLSLASGAVFGLIPTVKYAGPRLAAAIGSAGRSATLSLERQRSQYALVTIQMALALVLLVSSGLMIRSFQALRRVDPGFTQPQRVQTFGISIPATTVSDPERVTRMQQEMLEKIAAIPGVTSAAFTTRLPMESSRFSAALAAADKADDGRTPPNRHARLVSPGMFQTLGTPLVAGRDFTWTDLYGARDVAIVSDNLAREIWGSPAAALGKRIREYYGSRGPWHEIIGVAGDVHDDGAHQRPPPTVYWPARSHQVLFGIRGYQPRRVSVAIRSERAGTESLLEQLREAVWRVNADVPLGEVRTLDELFDQSLARTSFTLVMLAIAGAMALLLGIVGLYGVIAYAVSRRRREIGIRLALGAQAREIQALFIRRGLVLAAVGVTLGLGAAAGFSRLMESLLFGVSPRDPITFTAMPIVLAAAAVLACYLPARRALAVDPIETLRAE